MIYSLEKLVKKLNGICTRALEQSAEFCLSLTNYTIEIEHILLKLLDIRESDLNIILKYFGVDVSQMRKELMKAIEEFDTGNRNNPVFSSQLVMLFREGFLISSLFFNEEKIRSGALLLGILEDNTLRGIIIQSLPSLLNLNRLKLKENAGEIFKNAKESKFIKSEHELNKIEIQDKESETPYLDQYTIDLLEKARQGEIDPVIGREVEISQVIEVLLRRRQNNPILTGEAGVGKTAIVEGLALLIHKGEIPDALKSMSLRVLDLGLLQAGAGIRGEFEKRLKKIVNEIKDNPLSIVLFIDEAHLIIGAGGQAGQMDAANLLKPALARGELRTIAATTWSEYKKYFEKDSALARRFQVIKIDEPDEKLAVEMVAGLRKNLEKHHDCVILDEAVQAAVSLSRRYMTERFLPDKAVGLLDTACAKKSLDDPVKDRQVERKDVAGIAARWTGIPIDQLMKKNVDNMVHLSKRIHEQIIGQNDALDLIQKRIVSSSTDMRDPEKPIGVFLLVGPSGVGKTETARVLSKCVYNNVDHLIVINMSEYKEAYNVSLLKGSPPGYVGYGQGGILTEAVRRRPYSLVLLDEVEKAHPDVLELFYQVFDKGFLVDSEGVRVDFRNCVIMMTSNLHGLYIQKKSRTPGVDYGQLREELFNLLKARFKPSFLGRVCIVPYLGLGNDDLKKILKLKLNSIKNRFYQAYEKKIDFKENVRDMILSFCVKADTGAREMEHIIDNNVLPKISAEVLKHVSMGKDITDMMVFLDSNDRLIVEEKKVF